MQSLRDNSAFRIEQMKKVPDYSGSSFNPEEQKNDKVDPSPDRARRHEHAAALWNQVTQTT